MQGSFRLKRFFPPRIYPLLALAWVTILIAVALQPTRPKLTAQGTVGHGIIHVVVFGFTAILPLLRAGSTRQRLAIAIAISGFAATLEISQGLLYRFPTEWSDVVLDACGVFTAFALAHLATIKSTSN